MRGGYGLTYLDSSTDRRTQTGFTRTTAYVASLDSNRTPANRLSNPYPTGILEPVGSSLGPSTGLGTNAPITFNDRRIPEFHQWSVGFQHELPWRSVIDVSYVGSATRNRGVNQPVNDLSRSRSCLATPT